MQHAFRSEVGQDYGHPSDAQDPQECLPQKKVAGSLESDN